MPIAIRHRGLSVDDALSGPQAIPIRGGLDARRPNAVDGHVLAVANDVGDLDGPSDVCRICVTVA